MSRRRHSLLFTGLSLLILLSVTINVALAESDQLLQDIQYVKVKNQDAVKIIFASPVRYLSHFPSGVSKDVTINIETTRPDDGSLPPRLVQTLPIPSPNGIPLQGVALVIEETSKQVIVRFTRPVNFSVSQISGATSITIALEDSQPVPEIEKELPTLAIQPTEPGAGLEDEIVKKYMDAGHKALTLGKNSDAIQIYTKVLSMPPNKYTQDALELLGVARERSNQLAHAKSIYQQYIKLYPEGDNTDRVKQRLADLLSGQLAPREKLEPTTEMKRITGFSVRNVGNLSQYYYYGKNSIENTSSTADLKLLVSQFSLNNRIRTKNADIQNFIAINHDHDFIQDVSEDAEINSLYSKTKNSKHGIYFTIGRQSAATAGVLGRFDGTLLGYDITNHARFNIFGGYPVDISDKTRIQKEKLFYGVNVEFNDYWKDWSIAPYYLTQEIDGISDREVIGTEFRYFSNKGNFFSTIDYDILYDDLNIFMFRGQVNVTSSSLLLATIDYRKNPLLETSNALIGDTVNSTLEELSNSLTLDEIYQRAFDRTGDSSTYSLGFTHNFSRDVQLNADATYSQQNFKIIDLSGSTTEEKDDQTYYYAQLMINRLLNERDSIIFNLRNTETSIYSENLFSVSHRYPQSQKFILQAQLYLSERDNDSGEVLTRIRPALKMDFRTSYSIQFLLDISYEWWKYGGTTINNDYERLYINVGYRWLF
ncbi:tetratricopeptide repeat protein [Kaarinaea lacus]